MCRLFGMTAGAEPVKATFWLLDAPDSLAVQSRKNADGTGVGFFDPQGGPHMDKQPIAAFEDRKFAAEAKEISSPTFVSHVRHATNGGLTRANTHPFCQHDRLFAHNGVINDVTELEQHLGEAMALVQGDTDSERYFALISQEIDRHGGDIRAGIETAVGWIVQNLSVLSINFILITGTDLWALRYPDHHSLFMLERPAGGGGPGAPQALAQTSSHGTRIRSEHARARPVVIVASEQMDGDGGWQEVPSGHLVHVDRALTLTTDSIV